MCNLVFPLTMSETRNKYVNYYGEFQLEALKKDAASDFGMSETQSGVYKLVGINKDKVPSAKQIKVLCPHHCMQELHAISPIAFASSPRAFPVTLKSICLPIYIPPFFFGSTYITLRA